MDDGDIISSVSAALHKSGETVDEISRRRRAKFALRAFDNNHATILNYVNAMQG